MHEQIPLLSHHYIGEQPLVARVILRIDEDAPAIHATREDMEQAIFPFLANGRAKAMGEREGQVKLVADAATDRLLGAHIVGARASDLIAELVVAMELGASAEDVARSVHTHPTLPEAVKEAALGVAGRAIHI